MYKIWFEREAFAELAQPYAHIAQGIGPGDQAAGDPYHRLEAAHAVMAGGRIYNAAVMDRAPNLLIISRTGIGYDTVDVDAASERGIAVCNAPDAPTVPTAETAMALMLNLARQIKPIESLLHSALESGVKTNFWDAYAGIELAGKQLGLIGLGRIGGRVAAFGNAIGMRVVAYDPYISAERATELGVERADSLETLLADSDVVSLHLPLIPATRKLMNAERFSQMKRGAIFINVSRGGHVDEAALADALDKGQLFGAGLDVTDPEPPKAGNPLLKRDNVIITPHIGGASVASRTRLFTHAMDQIVQALRGERPTHLINSAVWDTVLMRWQAITV